MPHSTAYDIIDVIADTLFLLFDILFDFIILMLRCNT